MPLSAFSRSKSKFQGWQEKEEEHFFWFFHFIFLRQKTKQEAAVPFP
jgi:hypothetical protein